MRSIKVTLTVTGRTTLIALSAKNMECLNGSSTQVARSCGSMANVVTNSVVQHELRGDELRVQDELCMRCI